MGIGPPRDRTTLRRVRASHAAFRSAHRRSSTNGQGLRDRVPRDTRRPFAAPRVDRGAERGGDTQPTRRVRGAHPHAAAGRVMTDAVLALIERDGLLLSVWNRHFDAWTLPGGKVEGFDASITDALTREL